MRTRPVDDEASGAVTILCARGMVNDGAITL